MANNYPIEVIPAAAINEIIAASPAIIIDTIGCESIPEAIANLYSCMPSGKKIYYTRPGINQLAAVLERTSSLGIPAIVLCGNQIPSLDKILPGKSFSASLVAPGSSGEGTTVMEQLFANPALADFSLIGYQSYRTNPRELQELRDKSFEEIRLGVLREGISLAEPLLRTKEYIFLDIRSVRTSDLPDNPTKSPNGLYAEEVCQLARYIGMGQQLKFLFIFGIPGGSKPKDVTVQMVSEITWHVVEALSANIDENPGDPAKEELFLKKIVSMGQDGQDLVFVTSRSTGRWWMEVPDIKNSENLCIPCSFADYSTACSGEVPLRWLFFFQKINPN